MSPAESPITIAANVVFMTFALPPPSLPRCSAMRTAFLKLYWRDDRRVVQDGQRPRRRERENVQRSTSNVQFRKRRREALLISLDVER